MHPYRRLLLIGTALFGALASLGAAAEGPVTFRVERGKGRGWTSRVRYPVFGGGSALHRQATTAFRAVIAKDLAQYQSQARKHAAHNQPGPWSFEAEPTVSMDSYRLISGFYAESTYQGGAHGMTFYKPVTVGVTDGRVRRLTLLDLFVPGSDPVRLCSDLLMARLRHDERADWVKDGTVTSFNAKALSKWVVTRTGITFLFDPYELGSYAAGPFEIKIPFKAFKGALKGQELLGNLSRAGA
jgi:hypothetical protein